MSEGRSGILGFGAENARVRVTPFREEQGVGDYSPSVIAKEIISDLLNAMGVQATVVETPIPADGVPPGVPAVAFDIRGDDLGMLIGRRGQTLASFQYIVTLMVNRRLRERTLVVMDVEGYRQRRFESLREMALRIAERVRASGRNIVLEPMSPAERRIIHITLQDQPDISTHSLGEGENRKVSIGIRRRREGESA
ncbi:MAG: protein jag [Dehalococcoidia bacterium]|nr:protein jag [Dehalococcoidia bacterium]